MDIQKFYEKFSKVYYNISDKIEYAKLKKENGTVYKLLKENGKYKNKYTGKKCFILGNGPSLKDVDFNILKDECVFTMNFLTKYERFGELNPKFHLMIDGACFGLRKNVTGTAQETVDAINMLPSQTQLIIPVNAYDFIKRKKYKLNGNREIVYVDIGSPFVNGYRTIDMQYKIPGFRTVLQYAIAVAIYMGFKEIYLLGCDGTIIVHMLNDRVGEKNTIIHVYGNDEAQNRRTKQVNKNIRMDALLYDQYCIFNDYKKLVEECKRRGVKLYNLTELSLIDSVPRKSLNEIL